MNGTIRIPSTNTRASTLLLRCHSENHRSMLAFGMVKSISALVTAIRPSATLEGRTVMRHPDQSPLNRRPGVIQRIVFIINPPLGLREVFGNHIIYVHSAKQTGVRTNSYLNTPVYLLCRGLMQQRFTSTRLPWIIGSGIRFEVKCPVVFSTILPHACANIMKVHLQLAFFQYRLQLSLQSAKSSTWWAMETLLI